MSDIASAADAAAVGFRELAHAVSSFGAWDAAAYRLAREGHSFADIVGILEGAPAASEPERPVRRGMAVGGLRP